MYPSVTANRAAGFEVVFDFEGSQLEGVYVERAPADSDKTNKVHDCERFSVVTVARTLYLKDDR